MKHSARRVEHTDDQINRMAKNRRETKRKARAMLWKYGWRPADDLGPKKASLWQLPGDKNMMGCERDMNIDEWPLWHHRLEERGLEPSAKEKARGTLVEDVWSLRMVRGIGLKHLRKYLPAYETTLAVTMDMEPPFSEITVKERL